MPTGCSVYPQLDYWYQLFPGDGMLLGTGCHGFYSSALTRPAPSSPTFVVVWALARPPVMQKTRPSALPIIVCSHDDVKAVCPAICFAIGIVRIVRSARLYAVPVPDDFF